MKKTVLSMPGIHCDACKKLIEMETGDRGAKAHVDTAKKTVEIEFDEKKVKLEDIRSALKGLGYESKIIK